MSGVVPFGPLFGGACAGYVVVFIVVVALALGGTVPDAFAGFGLVVLLAGLVSTGTYIIGLSAVGGWVGNYLKYDTDIGG